MSQKNNRRLSEEKKQRVYHDWLKKTYPGLFNDQFLPLAVGVFAQLAQTLPTHITKTDLRITLGWYASRLKYLQSIRKLTHRINLDGSEAGLISAEDKAVADGKIQAILGIKKKNVKPPESL